MILKYIIHSRFFFPLFLLLLFFCNKEVKLKNDATFIEAKKHYFFGRLDDSEKLLKEILSVDEEFHEALFYLAKIHFYQGNFNLARKEFDKLSEISEYTTSALIWKAKTEYAFEPNRIQVLNSIDKLLKVDIDYLSILYISAKINLEIGNESKAIADLTRIIQDSEKIYLASKELESIYEKAGIPERKEYFRKLAEKWKITKNEKNF